MKVSAWVRKALEDLGADAQTSAIRDYILQHDPSVPPGHISLALRSVRAPRLNPSRIEKLAEPNGESLFDDAI